MPNQQLEQYNNEITNVLVKLYDPYIDEGRNRELLNKYYYSLKDRYMVVNTGIENLDSFIPNGKYIRYINLEFPYKTKNIILESGGFVLDDDSDYLMMTNNKRFWKLKKSKYLIFRKLTENELLRLSLENFSFN